MMCFLRQPLLMILVAGISANVLFAQDTPVPFRSPTASLIERLQIQGYVQEGVHSAVRPFGRRDVFYAVLNAVDSGAKLNPFDVRYALADNDEFFRMMYSSGFVVADTAGVRRPPSYALLGEGPPLSTSAVLGIFYTRPAHLYALDTKDFYLRISPIVHFEIGQESSRDHVLFINRRGVELRGGIDERVFFNTNIVETQLRPGSHIRQFVRDYRALPDAGLFKPFESRFFDSEDAYDYLSSGGYIGFNVTRHIGMQLGHGKNFIGDGYRSLFLSDFAKNYFYLKFNTRVWKFHYQNVFAELSAREKLEGNVVVPKKYLAAHYLSFEIMPTLSLGLFEAVVFARDENRFELQYLNPVILYRSIEHHVGSPDNVLIGLSARWDIAKRIRVYGQLVLDEFKFSEFFSSRRWWGNKYGFQFGVKYPCLFNFQRFDLQVEYNRVRPFTYTHYDSLGSYSHFNQALAHPFGGNFSELLFKLDYRPVPRLFLNGKLFLIESGRDTDVVFYGANILRSNVEHNAEFGIRQNQGVAVTNRLVSLTASYMLKHNLFLEVCYFRRNYNAAQPEYDLLTSYFMVGIRWNYFPSQDEF